MKHSIKIEKLSSLKGLRLRSLGLVFMILLILPTLLLAQSGWSINSSIQMAEGDYITGISRNNYYFNIGSRYRSESWYLSATISIIAQDELFSDSYSNDMMGGSSTPHLEMGIGDLFLFGEVNKTCLTIYSILKSPLKLSCRFVFISSSRSGILIIC